MKIMRKILINTFLLSVFLLPACSYLQDLEYNRELEHVVVDNGDVICEYVKGVRINCYKKTNESEVKNEKEI